MTDLLPTPRRKRRIDPARIFGSRSAAEARELIQHVAARGGGQESSESGISMIEVLVSTLLVALIVVGTFSGFDAATRASADERAHAQATVLAQQDEERLRALTATQIGSLGSGSTRSVTEGATTFKITSSARAVSSATEQFTCSTTGATADYLQTTSSVTWPALGSRAPITQSSIVSTPSSAGLLVKVAEQNEEGLEGATVSVTGASTTQVTPASGCVVFSGLSAGVVTVQATDGTYVDYRGKTPTSTEATLSGTALGSTELQLASPGTLTAAFIDAKTAKATTGDTFFALNTKIPAPADFVGGTTGKFAASASQTKLFPFTSAYTVFAGDCEKNNPKTVAGVTDPSATLPAGGESKVNVEEPEVSGIQVFEGTKTTPGSAVASPSSAAMINVECKATNSQNYTPIEYKHPVTFDASGNLVQKNWPYATKLEFCVVMLKSGTYYKYLGTIANTSKNGVVGPKVYLKETTTGYTKSTSKLEC